MYNSKFPSWDQVTSTGKYKDKYDGQMAYVYAKRGQVSKKKHMDTFFLVKFKCQSSRNIH